jgi:hypothetical protein
MPNLDSLIPDKALRALVAAGVLDDQLRQAMGSLADADTDVLLSALDQISTAGAAIDRSNPTAADLDLLHVAAAMSEQINAEVKRRFETQQNRERAADLLAEKLATNTDQAVAAAGQHSAGRTGRRLPTLSRLAARQPAHSRPTVPHRANGGPRVLTAGGAPVSDLREAAVTAAAAINRMVAQRSGWAGRDLPVLVHTSADYPTDRQLGLDENRNQELIEAVTGPQALAAAGGICGPVGVDYALTAVSAADRPVRDSAMAQFQASRGGVRYILPHTLAQITSDGPASIWTQGTDANPGASTKPHATFVCQAVQEAYVDAVTSIVQLGNFQARWFPEQISEYLTTAEAVHSRLAESTLLAAISAASTESVVADNYEIGGARDLLATLDRAASGYRYQNRMGLGAPLRLILPAYVLDMMRADLARNMPGDSGGQSERLAVSNGEINSWFSARSINVTWTLDSASGLTPLQGFGVQGAGQLLPWPTTTYGWLFHEGAWMFLDGGELNLGMVRDSVLNKTNDFQMFSETFEKAVFRGHASVQLALKIAPTGASVGTVAPVSGGTETIGS